MFPSTNIELRVFTSQSHQCSPEPGVVFSVFETHVVFFEPLGNTVLVSAASFTPAFGGHEE